MKKILYGFMICFLLGVQFAKSQEQTPSIDKNYDPSPLTPEAAALAKMVNYPVNHNTGIPDIRIPLYEIKTGGMSLPIELTYHSGGFKINEQASRAGLGWSLSCDLQITRTINGGNDFEPGYGYIGNPLINDGNRFNGNNGDKNKYDIATGKYDGMPDKFYYKLLNKSGSFYFRRNQTGYTIIPYPYDNIDIQYNSGTFIITDTDGCQYYFGNNISQSYWSQDDYRHLCGTEKSTSGAGADMKTNIMTWKCMKIENANNTKLLLLLMIQRLQKH
jgi:hypothetical protein